MTSVVLDTNIVVSAHLNSEGLEAAVLALAVNRRIQLFVSEAILSDYEAVLVRRKFGLSRDDVRRSLRLIRNAATVITALSTLTVSPDEPDNRFLECAAAARAEFLVTGNTRHFPRRWQQTRIVTAREFLSALDLDSI